MTAATLRRKLLREACRAYRPAGRFAYHFARGKLGGDPAFLALLEHGWLADSRRILDLGCGQGLLFSWLLAAQDSYARGEWCVGWPPPPRTTALSGLELMEAEVQRARQALGTRATFLRADLRDAALSPADAIVVLDVLHYLEHDAQERALLRMRQALSASGVLLLRIGDATGGLGFRIGGVIDKLVLLARGHRRPRLHCRPLTEWQQLLERSGFRSAALPMSRGTPFANVLLVAHAI